MHHLWPAVGSPETAQDYDQGVVEQVTRWVETGDLIDTTTAVAIIKARPLPLGDVWQNLLDGQRSSEPGQPVDVAFVAALAAAVAEERRRITSSPLPTGAPVRMQLRAQAAVDELGALAAYLENQRRDHACCRS